MTLQEAIKTFKPFKRPGYDGLISVEKETGALIWLQHVDSELENTCVSLTTNAALASDWLNEELIVSASDKPYYDLPYHMEVLKNSLDKLLKALEKQDERMNSKLLSLESKIEVVDERLQKSEIAFEMPGNASGAV